MNALGRGASKMARLVQLEERCRVGCSELEKIGVSSGWLDEGPSGTEVTECSVLLVPVRANGNVEAIERTAHGHYGIEHASKLACIDLDRDDPVIAGATPYRFAGLASRGEPQRDARLLNRSGKDRYPFGHEMLTAVVDRLTAPHSAQKFGAFIQTLTAAAGIDNLTEPAQFSTERLASFIPESEASIAEVVE